MLTCQQHNHFVNALHVASVAGVVAFWYVLKMLNTVAEIICVSEVAALDNIRWQQGVACYEADLICLSTVPVPEVAVPDNIRRRQATQTIATAPEPSAWLLRTEWPAQLAACSHQDGNVQFQGAYSSLQSPTLFVNPMKATVMVQEECQKQYPHMKMVSHDTQCM